ncbi:MAG: gliding motility-associated C-terminal domain-containing protein [Saprospiraceae bacterium]
MKSFILLLISWSALPLFAQVDCQFNAEITSANCKNQKGRIELTVVDGMPPFQYEWSDNADTKNSAIARGLNSDTYSVTILDAANCIFSDTFSVRQASDFSVSGELLPNKCDDNSGGVRLQVDNADSDVSYFYSINNLSYFFDNTFRNIQPGDYTLYAKTDNDCIDSTQFTIPKPEPISIELGEDYIVSLGDSLQLYSYNDSLFASFSWSPQEGLSCTDCATPMVNITSDTEFTLTVTDSLGCKASDAVRVLVQKDRNVYIPTVFSPNNDGVNDDFYIFAGEGVIELRDFVIYNRWGNLVHQVAGTFSPNDYRLAWDGKMHNRLVPAGEYVYQFTSVFSDAEEVLYQGIIKVMR